MNGKIKENKAKIRELSDVGKEIVGQSSDASDHQIDARQQSVARRASRVARAITNGGEPVKRASARKIAGGAPGNSNNVAGNSNRSAARLGPAAVGRSNDVIVTGPVQVPKLLKPKVVRLYHDEKLVDVIPRVSPGKFKMVSPMLKAGQPLNQGFQFYGAESNETEFMGPRGRHVRVTGRQMLGTVTFADTNGNLGVRSSSGVWLVSPDALGGRLKLLSQQFEEHKCNRLRLTYAPIDAAVDLGAIAFYFRNDISTPLRDVGLDELKHAATHPSFVQTSVWQPASLDIKPEDATSKYFDEENGDWRFQIQGVIQCLGASDVFSQNECGNVYLEYDMEFFGEELDYNIDDQQIWHITATWTAKVVSAAAVLAPSVLLLWLKVPAAGESTAVLDHGLGSFGTAMLWYGSVTVSNWVGSPSGSPIIKTDRSEVDTFRFEYGAGYYIRIVQRDDGGVSRLGLLLYEDLESAGGVLSADSEPTTGQLCYGNAGTFTGTVEFSMNALQLNNE